VTTYIRKQYHALYGVSAGKTRHRFRDKYKNYATANGADGTGNSLNMTYIYIYIYKTTERCSFFRHNCNYSRIYGLERITWRKHWKRYAVWTFPNLSVSMTFENTGFSIAEVKLRALCFMILLACPVCGHVPSWMTELLWLILLFEVSRPAVGPTQPSFNV